MIILDTLLVGGITFVLRRIAEAVDSQLDDADTLREELLAAQMRLELGEIGPDEFAAIDRHTQLITLATFAALLLLLLLVYRSLITAMLPLVTVVMSLAIAKPIISVLVDREIIGVTLFSLELSVAVVVGAGTAFAIFLIGLGAAGYVTRRLATRRGDGGPPP